MRKRLVHTSNVERFLTAMTVLQRRGAPEAAFVLVIGDAGHGKTYTAMRWGTESDAVCLRLKSGATRHWVFRELVTELGEPLPAHSRQGLFEQAVKAMQRRRRPIVLDEVENVLGHGRAEVLNAIRDLSDMFEMPVVLVGRTWVPEQLQRHRELWTRVSAVASFVPLSVDDVRLLRTELVECEVDDSVDVLLHAESKGYVREIMNGLAAIERLGKAEQARVDVDLIGGRRLIRGIDGEMTEAAL